MKTTADRKPMLAVGVTTTKTGSKQIVVVTSDITEFRHTKTVSTATELDEFLIYCSYLIVKRFIGGYVYRRVIAYSNAAPKHPDLQRLRNFLYHIQTTDRKGKDFLFMCSTYNWRMLLRRTYPCKEKVSKEKVELMLDLCFRKGERRIRKKT